MLNLISLTMQQGAFGAKTNILDLCLAIKYMILPDDLKLIPISCNNITIGEKIVKKEIAIGIPIHVFIYGNIYKKQVEAFISRYYLGKYIIDVTFCPISI